MRQVFQQWASNTADYDEDPMCEAKRTWGALFVYVYDEYAWICSKISDAFGWK